MTIVEEMTVDELTAHIIYCKDLRAQRIAEATIVENDVIIEE